MHRVWLVLFSQGKRFYTCKKGHGIIVIPNHVALIGATKHRESKKSRKLVRRNNTFDAIYIGSTVSTARKKKPLAIEMIAKNGLDDIMGDDSNSLVRSDLQLANGELTVVAKKKAETLQEHAVTEILFVGMVDKTHLVYITSPKYGTLKRQGAVKFCHAFTIKEAVGQAAVSAVEHVMELVLAENEKEDAEGTDVDVDALQELSVRRKRLHTASVRICLASQMQHAPSPSLSSRPICNRIVS